jgi:hypothetical protein
MTTTSFIMHFNISRSRIRNYSHMQIKVTMTADYFENSTRISVESYDECIDDRDNK